jgi:hypothetical protein
VADVNTRPRTELLFLRVFSLGRRSERMFDAGRSAGGISIP